MTTRIDWCEICEEASTHAKICEVCGELLVERPAGSGNATCSTPSGGAGSAAAAAASAASAGMTQEEAAAILSAVEAHRIGSAAVAATPSEGEGPSTTSVAQSWAAQDQELLLEAARTATDTILATGVGNGDGGEWQAPPPEAMNPTAAAGRDRPTSKECIERIPRIAVGPNSSVLHECSVTVQPPVTCGPFGGCGGGAGNPIKRKVHAYDSAVVAEFGPAPPYTRTGRLVLCHPATGRGGLEPTTVASLAANANYPTIAYMERGDGVTFVRKALMAQAAGASAVMVGNNCGVWPYVMQDSAGEATKGVKMGNLKSDVDDDGDDGGGSGDGESPDGDDAQNSAAEEKVEEKKSSADGVDKDAKQDETTRKEDSTGLKIPVVMVKRSDGSYIRNLLEKSPGCTTRCTIAAKVLGEKGGCIICTDKFEIGDTVMRLPFCSHCFHEKCALTWLKRHNTCPMCRRELPTDDEEYESRRRAEGRSYAAASGDSSGLDVSQWESLFG